jgi:hypothetical protein
MLESAVKGRGREDLARSAAIDMVEEDKVSPDLTGLSCRWKPIKAVRGAMVALVVRGEEAGDIYGDLVGLTGGHALRAASIATLSVGWPPPGLMLEVHAWRRRWPLPLAFLLVAARSFLSFLIFRAGRPIGPFDPERYRREMETNVIDFSLSGETLSMVFDCPADRVSAIKTYLDRRARQSEIAFGMHVADHAIMTCLVGSAIDGRHIHFADGGDGGLTRAATGLKAMLAGAECVPTLSAPDSLNVK